MEKENKFDKMKNIRIDYLTSENFDDLINCKYDLDIDDLVVCDHCNSVFSEEDIVRDEVEMTDTEDYWDYNRETPEQKTVTYNTEVESCPVCGYGSDYEDETFYCSKYTLDMLLNGVVSGLEDYVSKDFFDKLKNYLNGLDENKKLKKCESSKESKMNLQEATIKALYDGLKDDTEVEDIEGLVDDVLVVTDPEITTDEYNEVIERADEIIENTPEGDIPLDPTYLGEYVQLCPICGGSFVEDHIFEPGTACPICFETPEAFVLVGKLQAEEEVAEDNGLIDDNNSMPNVNKLELSNTEDDEIVNDSSSETEPTNSENSQEEPVEEQPEKQPIRVRGARQRREKVSASKQIPSGNILVETRVNQALLKDRDTNKTYTYKELQDMYKASNSNVSFDEYINDLLKTGNYIDLKESVDPEEGFEINKNLANEIDGLECNNMRCSYQDDTNTVVLYLTDDIREKLDELNEEDYIKAMNILQLNDSLDEIDTFVYRNETVDEMKQIMNTQYTDFINRLDKVLNNKLDESDNQKSNNEAEYTVELVFEDKIKELVNNSAFTWEGMSADNDNLKAIVEDLKANTNIILPVHFYVFDGRTMNRMYGLTENNAYPDNLTFISIDLDNWSKLGNLPFYKMQVGARWLDDIVDNNMVRQNNIDGTDEEI